MVIVFAEAMGPVAGDGEGHSSHCTPGQRLAQVRALVALSGPGRCAILDSGGETDAKTRLDSGG